MLGNPRMLNLGCWGSRCPSWWRLLRIDEAVFAPGGDPSVVGGYELTKSEVTSIANRDRSLNRSIELEDKAEAVTAAPRAVAMKPLATKSEPTCHAVVEGCGGSEVEDFGEAASFNEPGTSLEFGSDDTIEVEDAPMAFLLVFEPIFPPEPIGRYEGSAGNPPIRFGEDG